MADDAKELKRVDWEEVFSFTRVFRSGKLARNLSNLVLGLTAVFLICLTGWVMDEVASWGGGRVMVDEIALHGRVTSEQFKIGKTNWEEKQRPDALAQLLVGVKTEKHTLSDYTRSISRSVSAPRDDGGHFLAAFRKLKDEGAGEFKAPDRETIRTSARDDWSHVLGEAESTFAESVDRVEELIAGACEKAEKDIDDDPALAGNKEKKSNAESNLWKDRVAALRALTEARMAFRDRTTMIRGQKISHSFLAHENACLKQGMLSLLSGDITTGLAAYRQKTLQPGAEAGFIVHMLQAASGFCWLFYVHWLYGPIFVLISLAIWALFGGAMYRVSALQAARDEKISLFQALRFSQGKFLSFFAAPLVPLLVILGVGVGFLMLGGLLTNIPLIGPILVGVLFFFALIVGLLIAFMLVGLFGGLALMFPTIAVEGSDCFDAISRSCCYVFSRPWRSVLYGVVALLHGTACYAFVRLFAFLALASTHFFVRGAIWTGGQALPGVSDPDKMDVLWTAPTFRVLHAWNWDAMSGAEAIGAVLIMVWVYVIVGLVASFALSYLVGSTTTIYCLLRRKVDATDYDEVFVEEEEEPTPASIPEAEVEPESEAEPEPEAEEADAEEEAPEPEAPAEDEDDQPESKD
jgi:hypothetical protein